MAADWGGLGAGVPHGLCSGACCRWEVGVGAWLQGLQPGCPALLTVLQSLDHPQVSLEFWKLRLAVGS